MKFEAIEICSDERILRFIVKEEEQMINDKDIFYRERRKMKCATGKFNNDTILYLIILSEIFCKKIKE